jgi:ribosomal protein L11 methylase PrmA
VILANIVSGVLLDLLPLMARSLSKNGGAVLSGILLEERTMMERALSSSGWKTIAAETEGAWWSVAIQRA